MGSDHLTAMSLLPNKPRPGRRRPIPPLMKRNELHLWATPSFFLSFLILITIVLTPTVARDIQVPYQEYDSPQFRRLARRGEIAIDRRAPPPIPTIQ